MNESLTRLAAAGGIANEYWDALGVHHLLDEESARLLLRALGLDPDGDIDAQCARLAAESAASANAQVAGVGAGVDGSAGARPDANAAPPARCFIPDSLLNGRRIWGLSIQLYSLRSSRNWGVGDFTDLADFAVIAARCGARVVGINPLHARHLARPGRASPYSPSSRVFIDPMAIDVEAVPDVPESPACMAAIAAPALREKLERARAAPLVDHEAVCALKLPVLEQAFAWFDVHHGHDDPRGQAFARFVAEQGAPLARYAEFEAIRLDRARKGLPVLDWHAWEDGWRDPHSPLLQAFRDEHARDIRFVAYLQWEAARQLDAASATARAAGLEFALYRDLAVGAAKDSAEAWGDQALTVASMAIGAPPDQFSAEGQNWGLPPWNPRVLRARAFEPFAALLAANMACAGALRIDHVMALMRLFWIPDGLPGARGAYIRQPFVALAAAVAEESHRRSCLVVGEDLGSVPEGLRERLQNLGFLSYRVLLFERHWQGDAGFKRPHEYPTQALATVMTHDLPTIADYWTFGDIHRRARLGLLADDAARDAAIAERHDERWKILALLTDCGLLPADPEDAGAIADALHTIIARTPSMLAIVQLDDLLGETEPANIPGTDREYPNFRRKLSLSLEQIAMEPRLVRLAATMKGAGRD